MDNRPRYRVPDELRETLLDFTIAYLLERPPNLIEFGISFFQRLKGEREQGGAGGRSSQVNGRSNEIDDNEGHRHRRHSRHGSHKRGSGGGAGPSQGTSSPPGAAGGAQQQRGVGGGNPALHGGIGGVQAHGNHEEEELEADLVRITQAATQVVEETVMEAEHRSSMEGGGRPRGI